MTDAGVQAQIWNSLFSDKPIITNHNQSIISKTRSMLRSILMLFYDAPVEAQSKPSNAFRNMSHLFSAVLEQAGRRTPGSLFCVSHIGICSWGYSWDKWRLNMV